MKLFGKELKLFFVDKISDNWAYEIEFFKWMGSFSQITLYENSISLRLQGDHRGIYWSYHILGLKVIELNVYDTRHEEQTPIVNRGLDH